MKSLEVSTPDHHGRILDFVSEVCEAPRHVNIFGAIYLIKCIPVLSNL